MIAYLSLYKLRPEVTEEQLEDIMTRARMALLRIPEVLIVKTGKRVNPSDEHPWFIYLEVESMDKLAICQDDPDTCRDYFGNTSTPFFCAKGAATK